MNTTRFAHCLSAALLVLATQVPIAHAQALAVNKAPALRDQLHAQAVASFRQGRFSEAYGRLIPLADAGHVPAAEMALWMYSHGTAVFGKDWDCTPEQLAAWAQATGRPVQAMAPVVYPRTLVAVAARQR